MKYQKKTEQFSLVHNEPRLVSIGEHLGSQRGPAGACQPLCPDGEITGKLLSTTNININIITNININIITNVNIVTYININSIANININSCLEGKFSIFTGNKNNVKKWSAK